MSHLVINSFDEAFEAATQYLELGLPMPTDLQAYLVSFGLIVSDDMLVDHSLLSNWQVPNDDN